MPSVNQGWNLMKEEQENMLHMNDFFCGLHYIVGMVDQTEAALKVYRRLLFSMTKWGVCITTEDI